MTFRAGFPIVRRGVVASPPAWDRAITALGLLGPGRMAALGIVALLVGCGTMQQGGSESTSGYAPSMNWSTAMPGADLQSTAGVDMPSTAELKAKVSTYRRQVTRLSRGREPLEWARTQYLLGLNLTLLGLQTQDSDRSEEAVAAYDAALEEYTRAREPVLWASLQRFRGTALAQLADQTGDRAHSDDAVSAYRAALEVQTRQRMPLEWAETQEQMGTTLLKRAWPNQSLNDAEAARAALAGAYEVFSEAGVIDDHAVRPHLIAFAEIVIDQLREEGAS